jgi:uncharacterized protein YndB with AHSA1/START domain
MTHNADGTIRITRRFDASIERVFDAWLDPKRTGQWLFATPTGKIVRVEIDARVGGSFVFTRRDDEDIEHVGTYLEIDRPRRLVFTFAVPKFSAQSTRVTIDLKPLPQGCELTLTHEGVLPEWAERSNEGWAKILGALDANLDQQTTYGVIVEPGTVRFERLLPGPIERVWAYLTQSDKRGKWFASGELEPRVGGSIELFWRHADLSIHKAPIPERYRKLENGHRSRQRVVRYEPPTVLAFTFGDPPDEPSEVTFELTPQGDEVLLVLTHRRLANQKMMDGVAGGWHSHLTVLVERLNNREPRAFWTIHGELDGVYERRFAAE